MNTTGFLFGSISPRYASRIACEMNLSRMYLPFRKTYWNFVVDLACDGFLRLCVLNDDSLLVYIQTGLDTIGNGDLSALRMSKSDSNIARKPFTDLLLIYHRLDLKTRGLGLRIEIETDRLARRRYGFYRKQV